MKNCIVLLLIICGIQTSSIGQTTLITEMNFLFETKSGEVMVQLTETYNHPNINILPKTKALLVFDKLKFNECINNALSKHLKSESFGECKNNIVFRANLTVEVNEGLPNLIVDSIVFTCSELKQFVNNELITKNVNEELKKVKFKIYTENGEVINIKNNIVFFFINS